MGIWYGDDPQFARENGVIVGLLGPSGVVYPFISNYTFSNLPSAASNSGRVARVTDLENCLFESNGVRWKPINGVGKIASLDTAGTMSGTTETILFQKALPAGLLKNADRLRLRVTMGKSGTVESATFTIRFGTAGTTADTSLTSYVSMATTNISSGIMVDYKRITATSFQKMGNGSQSTSYSGASTAAVNTATAVSNMDSNIMYLSLSATMSAVSETFTMHDVSLEMLASQV